MLNMHVKWMQSEFSLAPQMEHFLDIFGFIWSVYLVNCPQRLEREDSFKKNNFCKKNNKQLEWEQANLLSISLKPTNKIFLQLV